MRVFRNPSSAHPGESRDPALTYNWTPAFAGASGVWGDCARALARATLGGAALFVAACGGDAPANQSQAEGAATSGEAPEGAWTVNYAESRLGFSATQTGKSFDGEFGTYDAKIVFDPADLSAASIDVTIDMNSAKTGDKQRDAALPSSDWFKAKDFPSAQFMSTNIEETGEGVYVAHGALTIRDATTDIDLPFRLAIDGDTAKANGEVTLLRTDYGVGQGDFVTDEWVGLEVKVTVDVTATK